MRTLLVTASLVSTLLVLLSACGNGSGSGSGVSGQYGDKCEIACKPPAGPCGSTDPTDCQQACVATTEGLAVECAQCLTEHSGWSGSVCVCSGGSCSQDDFQTGGSGETTGNGDPSLMCDPVADTKCSGFRIEAISDSTCKSFCVVK